MSHFNPRAPRGARHTQGLQLTPYRLISIHVPREGHDRNKNMEIINASNFNPRAPRGARPFYLPPPHPVTADFNPRAPRGARLCNPFYTICTQCISIHVPREGHDAFMLLIVYAL